MSCNCGCGGCQTKNQGPLLTEGKVKSLLSEGLNHHISNAISLHETVYRYGSEKHLALIKEARKLYSRNIIDLNEHDVELIKTHLGEFALYEGESVPLDLPMLNEELSENKPSQEEVNKFFLDTQQEIHYLNSKPVKDWDEYDMSNWKAKLKKKEQGRSQFGESLNKELDEAEFKGKDVPLGKPKRGGSKAYYVYVKDGDKVKKVSFGSGGLRAKIKNKEARNAFAARHKCKDKKDRTKAGYWSCNLPRYAKALGLGANMNTFW